MTKHFKNLLLLGAFLIVANTGFAQTAIIHIYENNWINYAYYEVDFRKVSDDPETSIMMIVFPQSWEDLWNEQYSICTLTGLENETTYEVRIRGIIEYSDGTVEVGDWEVFTFETPPVLDGEWWSWEVGPFEVRYGQYYPYLNNSNTPLSDSKSTLEIEKLVAIREEKSKND